MSHALVVGGTGMLWDVSIYLASKFDTVSVIAKSSYRLNNLWEEAEAENLHINPLQLDYKDEEHLEQSLQEAIKQHGPIDLIIAWIHNEAPEAPVSIGKILDNQGTKYHYFDLWGFAATSDSDPETEREEELQEFDNIVYHKVVLGFIIEDDGSRWLTNEEISKGVIRAIEKNEPLHIIGEISPISEKP